MKASDKIALLLSCEHGGNLVPQEYADLFDGSNKILSSHRGYDKGALKFAKYVSQILSLPLIFSETTRLLVDLNRSLHHRRLFSEFTKDCSGDLKNRILKNHYHPYRKQVINAIDYTTSNKMHTIHLSFHSFTPVLDGSRRNADIGLLYDPSRPREKEFCRQLKYTLTGLSDYSVRLNYPYRGTADGLTTALRKKYSPGLYSGIEIEINQKYTGNSNTLISMAERFCAALLRART